jgi:tripartite-type tricarboxylate transporter receptor subunit TctC
MGKRRSALVALLLPACLGDPVAQAPAAETSYPAREIRFIVPFPPGGGNDVVGRMVAGKLQEVLGQSVLVENRGGAGGTTGSDIVAKAPPDGYTLLINNISLAINATLFPKLPYDTLKSLQPVSLVGRQPNVLAVAPALKVASVAEFLKLARNRPDGIIYGSGGPGSSSHLAGARLQLATGIRMTHVPYKGLAQAMTDLGAARVEMVVATVSTALPHMNTGKVHALAVTGAQRTPLLPKLPTMIEAGVKDYEVTTWYMVLAPARTPRRIVARLSDALRTIAPGASLAREFAAQGLDPDHSSPEQAAALLKSEIEKWGPVVKATGAKPG